MIPNSSPIQSLLSQFRANYPTGGVVAELLTVHQASFVVRALVQVGDATLSSGMAAASTIEQAEDQAKERALLALGMAILPLTSPFQSFPGSLPKLPSDYNPHVTGNSQTPTDVQPPVEPSLPVAIAPFPTANGPDRDPLPYAVGPDLASSPDSPPSISIPPSLDIPSSPDSPLPVAPFSFPTASEPPSDLLRSVPNTQVDSPTPPPLRLVPSPESSDSAKGKPTKRQTLAIADSPEPVSGSDDRSEEIARIGVEMKRLGWTTEQGRTYLKQTFGKRSRQELNDDELLDFLSYLETQPSPSQTPF